MAQEARAAGVRLSGRLSIEKIANRRMQLWGLTTGIVALAAIGLGAAVVSSNPSGFSSDAAPRLLGSGFIALVGLGFCFYAWRKEVHLQRLGELLVDERILSSAMATRLRLNASLVNAGKALNSVLDLPDVLDAILANALDLLGAENGAVMLLEADDALRIVASRGAHLPVDGRVRATESIAGHVAMTREPLLLPKNLDPGDPRASLGLDPGHGSMCAPLVHRGELLGVLCVECTASRTFDEYDLHALILFAEPVAAAIAKAELYAAEQTQVAELLEQDRHKTQFVATVSHELKTPITSILGAVTATRKSVDASQRAEFLDVIDRQSARLLDMVDEILVAARLQERERKATELIDLAALVRLTALDSQVAGRPVEVVAPTSWMVQTDPEAMRRIVTNLVENAHKYGRAPVRIALQPHGNEIVLSVMDRGPGIPVEHREKVFERFYRCDPNGTKPGVGLGLAIVRGLVDSCGGSVWVEDAPGGGAAFRIALASETQEQPSPAGDLVDAPHEPAHASMP
jgi:K+-sensing histidine kinase KdpD